MGQSVTLMKLFVLQPKLSNRIKTKKELMEALGPTWNAPECFDFKTYDPSAIAVGDISHSVAIFFILIDFLKAKTICHRKPPKNEAVK